MGPSRSSYLSNTAFFHFHDYGKKRTNFDTPAILNFGKKGFGDPP